MGNAPLSSGKRKLFVIPVRGQGKREGDGGDHHRTIVSHNPDDEGLPA
jgi:hypothetical protein